MHKEEKQKELKTLEDLKNVIERYFALPLYNLQKYMENSEYATKERERATAMYDHVQETVKSLFQSIEKKLEENEESNEQTRTGSKKVSKKHTPSK